MPLTPVDINASDIAPHLSEEKPLEAIEHCETTLWAGCDADRGRKILDWLFEGVRLCANNAAEIVLCVLIAFEEQNQEIHKYLEEKLGALTDEQASLLASRIDDCALDARGNTFLVSAKVERLFLALAESPRESFAIEMAKRTQELMEWNYQSMLALGRGLQRAKTVFDPCSGLQFSRLVCQSSVSMGGLCGLNATLLGSHSTQMTIDPLFEELDSDKEPERQLAALIVIASGGISLSEGYPLFQRVNELAENGKTSRVKAMAAFVLAFTDE